ncbi:hypothetical protein A3K42_00400 [candidate division WWE3 bacterium RBG_13_37_7]|uniref:Uncharacterized protein n=1 Tax=candidate division WWE3 bacterium RBG_13_37_7 TaxID=1802609 RepID=A0A1F4U227_UNCKA|nr:MAG: hypothetical protein A3K42_00400 [candidate division WWE3 bacterium RBG_13_37_7]
MEIDPAYDFIVHDFYAWVKTTYANDAGVLVSIAEYEKKLGWSEDYEKTLQMIKVLRPDLLNWRI